MAITERTVSLDAETVSRIQDELRALDLDGWLLYDFRGANPVATGLLGLPALTRRWFVYVGVEGAPVALTHRIEQQPWTGWIGENRRYSGWRELEAELSRLLAGTGRVAMEVSEGDGVPYVDLTPAGVLEMVRTAGARVASSADLVSAFYSRWTPEGEASHHRAAAAVRATAHAAFARIAEAVRAGGAPTEWEMREWVRGDLARRGLAVGVDTIVAVNANAANPHYAPSADRHATIREGDLVLIDLWGKEDGPDAVYADQTWMAFVGAAVPERLREIFRAVVEAREAAVALVRQSHAGGRAVAGGDLDDAARRAIVERGYGDAFIHRTGHSIDRELHGSGPNIDNLETRDDRRLIRGIGFSVEPGIYLAGDVGFRSEINVYMGADGPVVTTPEPQGEVYALLGDWPGA
jgi:Xaa-Pro dipeptidase